MPEVLGPHGVYFDPESPTSIADALRRLLQDASLRQKLARGALGAADTYSWAAMSRESWAFLTRVAEQSA
jgi:glycosyltransferase involved in cell wall biosynthesis